MPKSVYSSQNKKTVNRHLLPQSGQSLIEVIIAFGVIVVLAISLINASLLVQRSARTAKNNTQAARLAQQNIEQIRILRDRQGYDEVKNGNCYKLITTFPDPLTWQLKKELPGCGEKITLDNTEFTRAISIGDIGDNRKLVTITVSWTDSGGDQSVTNNTYLSKWCSGIIVAGSPCP